MVEEIKIELIKQLLKNQIIILEEVHVNMKEK